MSEPINGYCLSLWGRAQARAARKMQGRCVDDPFWLLEASKLIAPNQQWNQYQGFYADSISHGTWHRFLYGKRVRRKAFYAYCCLLNLEPQQVKAKQWFDWFAEVPMAKRRQIRQINHSGRKILNLVRQQIEREIRQVSEIYDVTPSEYELFLRRLAWFMRDSNSNRIKYADLIHIAGDYLPLSIARRFPLEGMILIKRIVDDGSDFFVFSEDSILDYLIAEEILSSLNNESNLINELQTKYEEDMLISQMITEMPSDYKIAEKFIESCFLNEVSKFTAVNCMGILAKRVDISRHAIFPKVIDFVFSNSDISDLYEIAVFRRVIGGNLDNLVNLTTPLNLEKIKREVVTGYDPVAAIFCLKFLSRGDSFEKMKQIISVRYGDISVAI